MMKRPLTPAYVFFFILFWPDTWRLLMGVCAAVLLVPQLIRPDMGVLKIAVLHLMVICIGYAISGVPAVGISNWLKKLVLKNNVQ